MITLRLNKLRFFSYHGLYPGEDILGNEFEVTLEVTYDEKGQNVTSIQQTISYEHLFNIIKARMDIPTPLLETIAIEAGKEIHSRFPFIKFIRIDINKLRAPIVGIDGSVGVSWYKDY
jgi:7,8-dihydroneopterin aldolase/epimerase/oxygenase